MVSIVVPWCDRKELSHTIDSFQRTCALLNGELIIVNYGGDPSFLTSLIDLSTQAAFIESYQRGHLFIKSRALNLGAAASSRDIFFFCDCDVILNPTETAALIRRVSAEEGVFATLKGVRETEINSRQAGDLVSFGYTLHLKLANGRTLTIKDHEEDANTGLRQAPGLLVVRRRDFEYVGGYNGTLIGWGWEDQDMIARLTLHAGLSRVQHGFALHISHDDASRLSRTGVSAQDRWESRDRMFRSAIDNYDHGRMQGTFVSDKACRGD